MYVCKGRGKHAHNFCIILFLYFSIIYLKFDALYCKTNLKVIARHSLNDSLYFMAIHDYSIRIL